MNKPVMLLGAALAGVGLMYFLDPILGKRRRHLLTDKANRYSRKARHAMDLTARDLGHRVQGVVARSKQAFEKAEVPGEILIERVRSELGHAVSQPSSISLNVSGGEVFLFGPVLEHERKRLVKRVRGVQGVLKVHDRLQSHTEGESQPGLQDYGRPARRASLWGKANWTPTTRALAVASGLGVLAWGASRRSFPGALLACGGATFLTRGIMNRGLCSLTTNGATQNQRAGGK